MKPLFRKQIYFDQAFTPQLDRFVDLLDTDPQLNQAKLKNPKQRFSAGIKMLISSYNQKREARALKNHARTSVEDSQENNGSH